MFGAWCVTSGSCYANITHTAATNCMLFMMSRAVLTSADVENNICKETACFDTFVAGNRVQCIQVRRVPQSHLRLHRNGRECGLGQRAGYGAELNVHLQNCDDHNVLSPNVLRCACLHGIHAYTILCNWRHGCQHAQARKGLQADKVVAYVASA